jgi:hypothetical protein
LLSEVKANKPLNFEISIAEPIDSKLPPFVLVGVNDSRFPPPHATDLNFEDAYKMEMNDQLKDAITAAKC